MLRNLFVSFVIFFVFLNIGCYEAPEKARSASLQTIGNVKLYTFASNDQYFLSNAQPYVLPANTSLRKALNGLGQHLSKTYFFKTYNGPKTNIRFEVVRIEEITIKPGSLKIAIINMVDKNDYAMKHFFQGSTGGQTTFSMLGATFIQPHLEPPLLDGLVIFYNGKTLPELDHINLSGILTPRLVRYVAKRAIRSTKLEAANSNQEWITIRKLDL